MTHGHLSEDELWQFAAGLHDDVDVDAISAHLSGCDGCTARLAEEARLELGVRELPVLFLEFLTNQTIKGNRFVTCCPESFCQSSCFFLRCSAHQSSRSRIIFS